MAVIAVVVVVMVEVVVIGVSAELLFWVQNTTTKVKIILTL